jgi:endonuclease-3
MDNSFAGLATPPPDFPGRFDPLSFAVTFGIRAVPIDPLFRVTKRLGWIPENTTYEKAHQILGALLPPKLYYHLHINLIRHGREICLAGEPRCEVCPLKEVCEYYRGRHKAS